MQYNKIINLGVFVLCFAVSIMAQGNSSAYDYPVKPGTPEWKALKSHKEMQEVCQIPGTVLRNITTSDLIQTCLNYPLYGDIIACDHTQEGFKQVKAGFNGLQELLVREDAGVNLIEKYRKMDPGAFDHNWTLIKKGEYASKIYNIEILLAQDAIITSLNKNDRILLMRNSLQKVQTKSEYPEVFGILSFNNIALIIGRILVKENYQPLVQRISESEKLKEFLEKAFLSDSELINEILHHADQYLTQNQ